MRHELVEILQCPHCGRGSFELEATETRADSIETGQLRCSECAACFPIERGVPNFLPGTSYSAAVEDAFSQQWRLRSTGALGEEQDRLFGISAMDRARATFESHLSELAERGTKGWVLDAGCGTGDILKCCSGMQTGLQYVGMDFSSEIYEVQERLGGLQNCHWVRGSVTAPPFRWGAFDLVSSLGVLHATEDTRSGFDRCARLVGDRGYFAIWIYPSKDERDFVAGEKLYWRLYYGTRDYTFMGRGHRLPPQWLYRLLRVYALPLRLMGKHVYRSAVFLLFDCVKPEYQHRHGRDEVEAWFTEHSFQMLPTSERGLHTGRRV